MKLSEYRSTGKDGTVYVSYQIKKINEHQKGIFVGEENGVRLELSFDPDIKENIPYKDPKTGAQKVFDACNAMAKPLTQIENVQLHPEYGNAKFQIPSKLKNSFAKCQRGDVINVFLRPFTDKEGKEKSVWALHNETRPEQKATPSSQEVNSSQSSGNSLMKDVPKEKQPTIPSELTEWANKLPKDKFLNAFVDDDIKQGRKAPEDFITWICLAQDCDTDYVARIQNEEERKATAVALFWALMAKYGV
jgi:hypothetical protein